MSCMRQLSELRRQTQPRICLDRSRWAVVETAEQRDPAASRRFAFANFVVLILCYSFANLQAYLGGLTAPILYTQVIQLTA
jgi:hypothetical protein